MPGMDPGTGRVYRGERLAGGGAKVSVREGGFTRVLEHARVYSRDEPLDWGHGGDAASDLSISLLADALGEGAATARDSRDRSTGIESQAMAFHQDFKWEVVANLDVTRPWEMSREEILAWASRQAETCAWCDSPLSFKPGEGWLHDDGSHGRRACKDCGHVWAVFPSACPRCKGKDVYEHHATPQRHASRSSEPRKVRAS